MKLKDLEEARQCVRSLNDSDVAVPHLTSIYRARECGLSSTEYAHSYLVKFVGTDGRVVHFIKLRRADQNFGERFGGYLINVPSDLKSTLTPYRVQGTWGSDKGLWLIPMTSIPGLSWGTLRMSHLMVGRQETIRPQAISSPDVYHAYGASIGAQLFTNHERAPGVKCEYSGTIAGAKYYHETEPCPRCNFTETVNCSNFDSSDNHAVTTEDALSRLRTIGAIWW